MTPEIKAMLKLSKACSIRKLTASGLVSANPCYVFYVNATPSDGAALYEGAVHNGENTASEVLIDIERQYGQDRVQGILPLYFNRGIYLALTTNMKSIVVQYLEEGR